MIIKALTLWQPWATLVMGGFKTYETRSWFAFDEGLIAIHAAKQEPSAARAWGYTEPAYSCLQELGFYNLAYLPRGAVLGAVKINGILRAETVAGRISAQEAAFGDFAEGRWAWRISNIRPFPVAVPARGRKKLWDWRVPDYLVDLVSELT